MGALTQFSLLKVNTLPKEIGVQQKNWNKHLNISLTNETSKIIDQFFLLFIKEDLLVIPSFVLSFAPVFRFDLEQTFGVGIVFLVYTVDDFPSTILITLPYVDGLTKIGLGY